MDYRKIKPLPTFSAFAKQAFAVKAFHGSDNRHYQGIPSNHHHLSIRRLHAKSDERPQKLSIPKLYEALQRLDDFNIEDFQDFVPGMQSVAQALLLHLGLITPTRPQKIIFFNTGWMTAYKGLSGDTLQGGGKFVRKNGWGSELFNFLPYRGKLYGYVQPKIDRVYDNDPMIQIEKLGASPDDQYIDGITVVWTASDPIQGGTRIIGWYKNARVYRYHHLPTEQSNRRHQGKLRGYFTQAKEVDCQLLPIDARKAIVRRRVKHWMGQSNVWYAQNNPVFVRQVLQYINGGPRPDIIPPLPGSKGKSGPLQPDPLKRLQVEKAAITCVSTYYAQLGFEIKSVEKDNMGWDLTATDQESSLRLEVKGLSGTDILTELTPNEYEKSGIHQRDYRICIVTNALEKPRLSIFSYSNDMEKWSDINGVILQFEERKSARIFI